MLFDFLKNISLIDEEYVKKYLPTSVERGSLETREGVILINQRKNKTEKWGKLDKILNAHGGCR